MSPGQDMSVIAAPASWKSLTPFPSKSRPEVLFEPETVPFELIVASTSPNTPSLLGSLSGEVPYASSTSQHPSSSESRSLESGSPSPSVSVEPFPSCVSRIPSLSSSASASSSIPSPSKSSLTIIVVTFDVSATAHLNPGFEAITLYW